MRRALRSSRYFLLASLSAIACAVVACSDDDDSSEATPIEPPTIELVRFRGSDGQAVDADAGSISLCDDALLTVEIGPDSDDDGLLDNWFLRPPDACGPVSQCGYVVTTVTSESGDASVTVQAASSIIEVDLSSIEPLSGEYTVRVELHQGETGEAFLVDDAPVADEATLSFSTHTCESGAGGAGAGGEGGAGLGGAGGAGGALGGQGGALGGQGGSD
jgi:hypothetical protein